VFYMALRQIGAIAGRLMAHGRPPDEPAVIVSHAATPRQHVIETTLAGLGDAAAGAEPPAVIALGPITALRPRLDWLGRLGAG
ncbi:MAG: uroporphyrin-III methyltransferase, partial [Rhodospirillaceae bacterium]|nr:uroporphyrin-III methyltransferase [Rhodospirillaceae bacterium]